MDINNAYQILAKHYNCSVKELENLLQKNLSINEEIILPYYGKIISENCKGIVYNHGLYTQCCEKNERFCKKCIPNKYGTIYDRANFNIGEYVTPNNKKEISYNSFIKKMNYDIKHIIKVFKEKDIDIKLFNINYIEENKTLKKRGRPKKIVDENNSKKIEIEVIEILYEGKLYLKTEEGILLDYNTYDIVNI